MESQVVNSSSVGLDRTKFKSQLRKTANDNYNQHLKAKALRDIYNANIEKAEKEWKGRGQKDRDLILGCLESRAQLSPFISHAYLDMGVWVMAVCNCPLLYTWLLI
ncbi:hypothetical protein EMCRGX_G003434 [Ephydatia muelleri]